MEVSVEEAANILGVNQDTIRRRLRTGALRGRKVARLEGGHTWLVMVPEASHNSAVPGKAPGAQSEHQAEDSAAIHALCEALSVLKEHLQEQARQLEAKERELESRRAEVADLLGVIRNLQERALPAPKKPGLWRRIWKR